MHGAWNMAAEFIGRPPTHIDNHQAWLSQALLEGFGIDQQRVCHVIPFVV
jgi:hypothetical protein